MNLSKLNDYNFYLFHQGTNYHLQQLLGAHPVSGGVRFAVWAPRAKAVSVVGDFNGWEAGRNPLIRQADGECWAAVIPGLSKGTVYKYALSGADGKTVLKADPCALRAERPPGTASVVWDTACEWQDSEWQEQRGQSYERPMLIYEVHPGSWKRGADGGLLSYAELAEQLVSYVKSMNYTHLELMPLCEHPFDGSWGYQVTGYFAATSRYGEPEELMQLVDAAHRNGIGVIMDWVPGHFCNDEHGLRLFDGANLYESDNPQLADNRDWGTTNFDYGRTEVQSFLISNALFWLEEYHLDGLRIDAVSNMLYLDYGRKDGEWTPNKYGGNGNLEAIEFLKKLNQIVFKYHPDALMIAEESTAWPQVSRPMHEGGLGFNYKWNMGWMNDMLEYTSIDPLFRKGRHNQLTFSFMYAFSENYVLPLSHDEVVHGKRSLIGRQPGDYRLQFAGLRNFFAYWLAHPGKKLLFMGGEFGQYIEWDHNKALDWFLTEQYPLHAQLQTCSRELNGFYCAHEAFWQDDFSWQGFEWIDCDDAARSIISFVRKANDGKFVVVVCNFTPEIREEYRLGVPVAGTYREVFNTNAEKYGGTGAGNAGELVSEEKPQHGREQSLSLTLPPLATIYLELVKSKEDTEHLDGKIVNLVDGEEAKRNDR